MLQTRAGPVSGTIARKSPRQGKNRKAVTHPCVYVGLSCWAAQGCRPITAVCGWCGPSDVLTPEIGWDKSARLTTEQGNLAGKHVLDLTMQPLGHPAQPAGAEQRIAICMVSYIL